MVADIQKTTYLFDLDGTLVIENNPTPYAVELIEYLNQQKRPFFIVTNGTEYNSAQIADKLSIMGMNVAKENILTTENLLRDYLISNYSGKKIYIVGSQSLKDFIRKSKIRLSENHPSAVVLSYDRQINMNDIEKGIKFIYEGADYLSVNNDIMIPGEKHYRPHTGLLNNVIETVMLKKPHILGKPSNYFFSKVKEKMPLAGNYCIVGDNIDSDIAFGINCHIHTILVLTGLTKSEDLKNNSTKPDKVIRDFKDLLKMERGADSFG